jgi:DNA-binding beta-propeller fold protein YncE
VPGLPFDVVSTPDGRFTFVSSDGAGQPGGGGGGAVFVYAGDGAGGRTVATVYLGGLAPFGMALSDHGRVLLVSVDQGIAVIDVEKAERGAIGAVVAQGYGSGSGGIEVVPTPDGRFAFESMEGSRQVDIFRLSGERRPQFVGAARVGALPVGIAFSPDGKTAYVTSEEAHISDPNSLGTLSVLRVAVAERHPAASVERSVVAGCAPVRVVVSPDGGTVWLTARQSDAVLGFSAKALATGASALVADVEIGQAPVGLALFDGGQRHARRRFEPFRRRQQLLGRPRLDPKRDAHGLRARPWVPAADDPRARRSGDRRHQLRQQRTRDGAAGAAPRVIDRALNGQNSPGVPRPRSTTEFKNAS